MALDRSNPVLFVSVSNAGAKAIPLPLGIRLMSLTFDQDEAKSDKLELSIDNHDLSNFDTPLFAIGNVITAQWGYPGAMGPARSGSITKVSGSLVLKVECKGASHIANLVPKSRTFENMRRSDIAKIIATEQGLINAPGTQIQETPVVIKHVAQVRETDAQFLRTLAGKEGFDYYQSGTGFHFHPRKLDANPVKQYRYFTDKIGDVESFSIEGDITAKPALVIHAGRDPLDKSNFAVYANNQTQAGRPTNASVLTLGFSEEGTVNTNDPKYLDSFANATKQAQAEGNTAAVALLTSTQANLQVAAIGNDDNGNVAADQVGDILAGFKASLTSTGAHVTISTGKDEEDAQAQANAGFNRAEQKALKLTLNTVGDALIEAKQTIQLAGFGRVLDGNYHVTNVNHKVGPGYKMTIKTTRSGVGAQTGMAAQQPVSSGDVNTAQGPTTANLTPQVQGDPATGLTWIVGVPTKQGG